MPRLWLWWVSLGLLILLLGTFGWLSGTCEWWNLLMGESVVISGLSMHRR
jgi:hypothetical protein